MYSQRTYRASVGRLSIHDRRVVQLPLAIEASGVHNPIHENRHGRKSARESSRLEKSMKSKFDQLPPDQAKNARIADQTITLHLLRSRPSNDHEAADALAALLGMTMNYLGALLGTEGMKRIMAAVIEQMDTCNCPRCQARTRH